MLIVHTYETTIPCLQRSATWEACASTLATVQHSFVFAYIARLPYHAPQPRGSDASVSCCIYMTLAGIWLPRPQHFSLIPPDSCSSLPALFVVVVVRGSVVPWMSHAKEYRKIISRAVEQLRDEMVSSDRAPSENISTYKEPHGCS